MRRNTWPIPAALPAVSVLACFFFLYSLNVVSQTKQDGPQDTRFHWDSHAWQELSWKDWLERARIRTADRGKIADVITEILKTKSQDYDLDTNEKLNEAVSRTRVKEIDLDGDGVPEIVAQGYVGCSATGNCPLWIFQRIGKSYSPLLETEGQTFTIQKHSTNGYRDIVVSFHGSATQSGLTDYRYSEGQYVAAGCYNAEWEVLEGDKVVELKVPRITPFACNR